MSTSTVYCTTCAKDVHLACTVAPTHLGEANLPDAPQLVCLSFGSRCAGGRCPISSLPAVVMGVQLARSGMEPEEPWRTIRMHCEGCERVTAMEVLDNVHAFCPECGSTNRWFKVNMGEEDYVVTVPQPGQEEVMPTSGA
jgi:hypothetical protein